MIYEVTFSRKVLKNFPFVPIHIRRKLMDWVSSVEEKGLEHVRRSPGWHDEALIGQRHGQRSIRLSIKWRAIYVITKDDLVEFCEVKEVTPHDY